MITKTTSYFEKPGRENTEKCVKIARDAVLNEGYRHVVVAATGGDTALMLADALSGSGANLVAVTHSAGFKEPNTLGVSEDMRAKLIGSGTKVHTGTMPTHSLDTAFSAKFNGVYLTQIVANSLRRFGEGAKVCCECVMMAVDAGLVPEDEEVLAIAGTSRGADTVVVIKSAATKRFLQLRVLEFIAKPRA